MLRRLPESLVNRIAAGEVVERPASAVKELLENSLDAGARRIDVTVRNGGQSLIRVADNGCGMGRNELDLCIERHATSKLADDDLTNIRTFGFRGEALPSIAAVSRLKIVSRPASQSEGWMINVEAGIKQPSQPIAAAAGTTVDIRDLFFATPARLKFMKSPATELKNILLVIQKLAIAHPDKVLNLTDDQRNVIRTSAIDGADFETALRARLHGILGQEFAENCLYVNAERNGACLQGFISPPTVHRRQRSNQMLFVNNRPVQDAVLTTALRVAYQGLIAPDRHPYAVLFLSLPTIDVDVNVHPMKSEVRFRETDRIRSLLIGTLKATLGGAEAGQVSHVANLTPIAREAPHPTSSSYALNNHQASLRFRARSIPAATLPHRVSEGVALYNSLESDPDPSDRTEDSNGVDTVDHPLGLAKAQFHKTYIVAQNRDGVIIVDQHAAHERLVHEKIMAALKERCVPRQSLLIPDVVELPEQTVAHLIERSDALHDLGLVVEGFGSGAVVVREIPAILGAIDVRRLILDIADDLTFHDDALALRERLSGVYARYACHHSVRAGRRMSIEEMNTLLREMERTPHSGQCSHGRPTYVQLRLADIERLFGRK